ncbi:hypothetical protein BOX15_Mlig015388g2 [Macrostomum lignano]|uniref:Uncharacterized protein n=1 Tax=Macrostomum lignano TaxID=282301 RepID=A0A267GEJ0_9PLAT|nr:hypothetical protein BOX15_Mlig015388g2 [Macrostomum lignano]
MAEQPSQKRVSVGPDDGVMRVNLKDRDIVIDKRNENLILTDDCKRIMRNLCKMEAGPTDFTSATADLTQPSFLSPDEKALFFKMKMFYLLQERYCFLNKETGNDKNKDMTLAEAYPLFLSPFGEPIADEKDAASAGEKRKKRRRRKKTPGGGASPDSADGTDAKAEGGASPAKAKAKGQESAQKTGLAKFTDNMRKADQSVFRSFDEKILKTSEGKGLAALFSTDTSRTDMELSIFPDYNQLMNDGKDEESKLNNLVSHVRTRIKVFEKMQSFYETSKEDNLANVFTAQNTDMTEIRDEINDLKAKKLHQLDPKKMDKLYDSFKDDYATAKTTLIADGTQPVVLNRKKAERIKKYVEEFAELKNMVLPYHRESNFFYLSVPWQRKEEDKAKKDGESNAGSSQNSTSKPADAAAAAAAAAAADAEPKEE